MLTRLLFRLLPVLLLSTGAATGAYAAGPADQVAAEAATLTPPADVYVGAPLPAYGAGTIAVALDCDPRGRLTTTSQTSRGRTQTVGIRGAASASRVVEGGSYCDAGARLLRGGIHSSSLGTPPPTS